MVSSRGQQTDVRMTSCLLFCSVFSGSGGYADNQVGAVSTTGHGEVIMKVTLARLILFHMEQGDTELFKFLSC